MITRKEKDMYYQRTVRPESLTALFKSFQEQETLEDKIEWLKTNKQSTDKFHVKTINIINSWMNSRKRR